MLFAVLAGLLWIGLPVGYDPAENGVFAAGSLIACMIHLHTHCIMDAPMLSLERPPGCLILLTLPTRSSHQHSC